MSKPLKRKLTTILCADAKSYSHLMELDESATFDTLRQYRSAMGALIARHDGRIVNTWGDAVIAEFASVIEAVQCAVEIQQELAEKNGERAEERRMWFRVGINLGDVMVDNNDLYGEGVNIAARLQEIAEPGGITISKTVYDQVRHKLSVQFHALGEQQVKNVDEPVLSYRVALDPVYQSSGATRSTSVDIQKRIGRWLRQGERTLARIRRSPGFNRVANWWERQPTWSRLAVAIIGLIVTTNFVVTVMPLLIAAGVLAVAVYAWPHVTRQGETGKLPPAETEKREG